MKKSKGSVPAPSAPVADAPAPSAPPVNTSAPSVSAPLLWEAGRSAVALASAGVNFTRPSEGWDALRAFATGAGMPFPGNRVRDAVLSNCARQSQSAKGKANGSGAKWTAGYSFSAALTDWAKQAEGDEAGERRDAGKLVRAASKLWSAFGGVSFTVEAGE